MADALESRSYCFSRKDHSKLEASVCSGSETVPPPCLLLITAAGRDERAFSPSPRDQGVRRRGRPRRSQSSCGYRRVWGQAPSRGWQPPERVVPEKGVQLGGSSTDLHTVTLNLGHILVPVLWVAQTEPGACSLGKLHMGVNTRWGAGPSWRPPSTPRV